MGYEKYVFIGVASAMGHVPHRLAAIICSAHFGAAQSLSGSFRYSIQLWKCVKLATTFCDAIEGTKIVLGRGAGGTYDTTSIPIGGRGEGMPLPFFTQSTPYGVGASVRVPPRTKFWRRQ